MIEPHRISREARVVLLEDAAPPEGIYWTDPTDAPPHYTIGEVSFFFLGHGRRWLADLYEDHPDLAQHGFVYRNRRQYRLHDVECTVHDLTEATYLAPHDARLALLHVRLTAVQYGYLSL